MRRTLTPPAESCVKRSSVAQVKREYDDRAIDGRWPSVPITSSVGTAISPSTAGSSPVACRRHDVHVDIEQFLAGRTQVVGFVPTPGTRSSEEGSHVRLKRTARHFRSQPTRIQPADMTNRDRRHAGPKKVVTIKHSGTEFHRHRVGRRGKARETFRSKHPHIPVHIPELRPRVAVCRATIEQRPTSAFT